MRLERGDRVRVASTKVVAGDAAANDTRTTTTSDAFDGAAAATAAVPPTATTTTTGVPQTTAHARYLQSLFGDVVTAAAAPASSSPGAALAAVAAPVLREQLAGLTYNSFGPVEKLIDHLEKNGDGALDKTLRSFNVAALDDVGAVGGGTCVALAKDLVARLAAIGVPASICAVELPESMRLGSPLPIGHVAVVARYDHGNERGFVLLDPGLWWPQPIVVKDDVAAPTRASPWPGGAPWTFDVVVDAAGTKSIRCTVDGAHGGTSRFLVDGDWKDPDPYLEKAAAFSPRPRVIARSAGGDILACVAVLLGSGKPRVVVEANGQRVRLPIAPWADVEEALTEPLAQLLFPRERDGAGARAKLVAAVRHIVEGAPRLEKLRREIIPEASP